MSILSKLFGRGGGDNAETPVATGEDYQGFTIVAEPIPEGGVFRVSARIEKDGKVHKLIRADTISNRDEAIATSTAKARQMIDEQGDRLFG